MWQLSIVSPLILASFCLGAYQQANRPNVDYNNNDGSKTVLAESGDFVSRHDRECIAHHRCSKDGTFTDSGEGYFDSRFGDEKPPLTRKFCTEDGYCDDQGYTCCRYASVSNGAHDISPSPPVTRNLCGRSNGTDIHTRITGDSNEFQLSEFPWMVLISSEPSNNDVFSDVNVESHRCIGSLIGQNAVLTAARCVQQFEVSQLRVRTGKWDGQAATEEYARQDRRVERVFIHPQYDRLTKYNDYAILILDTPVDRTKNVDVVCLASFSETINLARCFVSGYGQTTHGNNVPNQPILKTALVRFIPRETCQQTIRTATADYQFVLDKSYACADREDGADVCQGNGGAPLVCAVKNDPYRYVQVGIALFDFGCSRETFPSLYANIYAGRKWIDETVAANDLDTTVYQYSP